MPFQLEPIIVKSGNRWSVGFISSETHEEWKDMDAGINAKFGQLFNWLAMEGRIPPPKMKHLKNYSKYIYEIELKGRTGDHRAYCYQEKNSWLITHFGTTDHSKHKTKQAAKRADAIRAAYMEFINEPHNN